MKKSDQFSLYKIKVETVACQDGKRMVCNHPIGSYFIVSGENISFPPDQSFPLYPLAAILPLIPAKQRQTHPNDWMTTDSSIACPDPLCGGIFQIIRLKRETFKHSQVTATKLEVEKT